MPVLQVVSEQYGDEIVFAGVDQREAEEVVQAFVEEFAVTFPILLGPAMESASQ